MQIFSNDIEGEFVDRPNRFVVRVNTPLGLIKAHCPNPGKLIEILTPGRKLILQKNNNTGKTLYTLVAAYYNEKIIPLYSGKANHIARELIIPRLFPESELVRSEYTYGHSRFDFYIETKNKKILLEVKACTLVEYKVGMFPDAPSLRATKHLTELSDLSKDFECHVLFVIGHRDAESFRPNIHTDPIFAQAMQNTRKNITFHAASIDTSAQGFVILLKKDIPIIWSDWKDINNQGVYLILLKLTEPCELTIGSLGKISFKKGYYIYCGSAKANLKQRIERHKRKRKNKHWHIDYLRQVAEEVQAFPIQSRKDLECSLAQDIKAISKDEVKSFGSTDCNCSSHLYLFEEDPRTKGEFIQLLFMYRHIRAFN
ncbi:DNA/RNA nuclease SfsA [Spirochaeta cellobiosiphila]|uniref:DNA/RNA nuclease SfsA n=1 Tax=Spirochaeta cellobiosiphila TaxID=504483 RepID=UPI0003F56CDA|nr:DNA/RNA nuclease SfsA [Spirochaeta cellobiosiphila]